MRHARGNRAFLTGAKLLVDDGRGVDGEADHYIEYAQDTPRALGYNVITTQRGRDVVTVEGAGGARQSEPLGHLEAVAQRAINGSSDSFGATGRSSDPFAFFERRTVPYVLVVETRQFGHPVVVFV